MNKSVPLIFLILLAMMPNYLNALWVLHGTVTDASTCEPLQGVTVSSTSQNFNTSNNNGQYNLDLGSGNWPITATKIGYNSKNFSTPFIVFGGYTYNFSLLMLGKQPYNCSNPGYHAQNLITEITISTSSTTSTILTTSVIQIEQPRSYNYLYLEVFVILAMTVAALFLYHLKSKNNV